MNLSDYRQLLNLEQSQPTGNAQPFISGTSREVTIYAQPYWNHTGLLLEKGGEYLLEVRGNQYWIDAYIFSGPHGFSWADRLWPWEQWLCQVFKPWCRSPAHNWFALMGALDADEGTAFSVGRHVKYQPTRDGELCCYANDVPLCYANNWGALKLTVTRL